MNDCFCFFARTSLYTVRHHLNARIYRIRVLSEAVTCCPSYCFASSLYIGTVNKVKRFSAAGLIVEVGHEGVFSAVLLHYHPLVAQRGDE